MKIAFTVGTELSIRSYHQADHANPCHHVLQVLSTTSLVYIVQVLSTTSLVYIVSLSGPGILLTG